MLLWESVKSEFIWEGSWRDICVQDVTLEGWQATSRAVEAAGFRARFTLGGGETNLPDDLGELFTRPDDMSPLWSVFVHDVQLNCHFFDKGEIEFDLDPREVAGQATLDGLVAFMRVVAGAVDRVSLMTPENMHDAPFIRVAPSGVVEYVSSDGFFEQLAEGRPRK